LRGKKRICLLTVMMNPNLMFPKCRSVQSGDRKGAGAVCREERRPLADARGSEHSVDLRLKMNLIRSWPYHSR
jgi:hypothetical protein